MVGPERQLEEGLWLEGVSDDAACCFEKRNAHSLLLRLQ